MLEDAETSDYLIYSLQGSPYEPSEKKQTHSIGE
jgi:hypothetical protein